MGVAEQEVERREKKKGVPWSKAGRWRSWMNCWRKEKKKRKKRRKKRRRKR